MGDRLRKRGKRSLVDKVDRVDTVDRVDKRLFPVPFAETGAIQVMADSRGQHVPSSIASILSILSIAACGNNSYQWVTDYVSGVSGHPLILVPDRSGSRLPDMPRQPPLYKNFRVFRVFRG